MSWFCEKPCDDTSSFLYVFDHLMQQTYWSQHCCHKQECGGAEDGETNLALRVALSNAGASGRVPEANMAVCCTSTRSNQVRLVGAPCDGLYGCLHVSSAASHAVRRYYGAYLMAIKDVAGVPRHVCVPKKEQVVVSSRGQHGALCIPLQTAHLLVMAAH